MLHQPKGWISNLLSSHVACPRESYDHPEKASQVSRSSGPRQGDRESNLKNSSERELDAMCGETIQTS